MAGRRRAVNVNIERVNGALGGSGTWQAEYTV